jgi:flavodoxin
VTFTGGWCLRHRWVVALTVTWLLLGCVPPAEAPRPDQMIDLRSGARAIVVVHSRSGHTARVGRSLAQGLDASFVRLAVPSGSGDGFWSTPNRHNAVEYTPLQVDLAHYDLVLLGCPVWYWRPTAFMYSFIKRHDFRGKRVVLFFTYESSYSKDAIPEWTRMVEERGGHVVDVLPFNRRKLDDGAIERAAATFARERAASVWYAPK